MDGAGVVDEDVDVAEGGFDLGEELLGGRWWWRGRPGRRAALPPAEVMAAAVSVAARRLPWTATVAPACESAVAMAAPRPVAAPVTRAILLSRRKRSRIDCGLGFA